MIDRTIITAKVILACLATSCLAAMVACSNKASDAALAAGQRAADIAEIQNLMSLHAWYHAAMQNDVELEKIWAQKTPDIVWAQNSGYWKGMGDIKAYYGRTTDPSTTVGQFVWHTITTPVIEVAQDRKTAKGVWYTPGIVGGYQQGKANASWMWERYGVDFVNENGKWKVWHMHVYTDFGVPVGQSLGTGGPVGPGGAPKKAEKVGQEASPPAAGPGMAQTETPLPGPTVVKVTYKEWGPDTVPRLIPKPPEPYRTFSETFSYADENEFK